MKVYINYLFFKTGDSSSSPKYIAQPHSFDEEDASKDILLDESVNDSLDEDYADSGSDINDEEEENIEKEDEAIDMEKVDETKFALVNIGKLLQLFKFCSSCGSPVLQQLVKCRIVGSLINVSYECLSRCSVTWSAQDLIPKTKIPSGNLALTAGTLLSGNTYTTLSEIAQTANMLCVHKSAFYKLQTDFVSPAISELYDVMHEDVMEAVNNEEHKVFLGDAR